jgi:DNA-binding NtrC family response regulator
LPENIRGISEERSLEEVDFDNGLSNLVEDYERNLIVKALEKNKNNKFQTAKMLNMNRSTFMSKLKKYDIK